MSPEFNTIIEKLKSDLTEVKQSEKNKDVLEKVALLEKTLTDFSSTPFFKTKPSDLQSSSPEIDQLVATIKESVSVAYASNRS